jgi:hypothetical protein
MKRWSAYVAVQIASGNKILKARSFGWKCSKIIICRLSPWRYLKVLRHASGSGLPDFPW